MDFSSVKPETISILQKCNDYLSSKNLESYIVGGFVRDNLLGRETADIDIAVLETRVKLLKVFLKFLAEDMCCWMI